MREICRVQLPNGVEYAVGDSIQGEEIACVRFEDNVMGRWLHMLTEDEESIMAINVSHVTCVFYMYVEETDE